MNAKWTRISSLAFVAILLPALVYGSQAAVPNQFVNGQVADADAVNANFNALANAINDNDTRLASVEGSALIRVPLVPGDPAASGQALIDALSMIPTDPLIDSYKVQLESGLYDVGATAIQLPDATALCGAGRERTTVRCTSPTGINVPAGQENEICDLTLRVQTPGVGIGVVCAGTGTPAITLLRSVRVEVLAGGDASGIVLGVGSFELFDTEIVAETTDANSTAAGVDATDGGGSLTARSSRISCSSSFYGWGVSIAGSPVVLEETTVIAPNTNGEGIRIFGGFDGAVLRSCRVAGEWALRAPGFGTIEAACSQLEGTNAGDVTTVHCYDENFAPIP